MKTRYKVEIILEQLKAKYDEAYFATENEFVPAVVRFINELKIHSFYKTFCAALLDEIRLLWKDAKPEEEAIKILRGEKRLFYEPRYREVVSYIFIQKVYESRGNNINLTSDNQKEYLKCLWERIERFLLESNYILQLLLNYKKRCEWYDCHFILEDLSKFRKSKTLEARKKGNARTNIRVEEDFFAQKANMYLFDNGISVISEEKVRGGRPDVYAEWGYGNFLVEYKVLLKSNKNPKKYLLEAFYQIYLYSKNYQKNTAYLVIFIIGEGDVTLNLDCMKIDEDTHIPYYEYDNIRIYALKINLKDVVTEKQIDKSEIDSLFRK